MKLYLASNGFPTRNQFKQLVGKNYSVARVAVIMSACDWRTISERKVRYNEMRGCFKNLGIRPDIVDLRKFYSKSPVSLAKKLQQYDFLWVRGGNSFFLRYVMKKSGFDIAIKMALNKGLVYAGQSAGSVVMGPTLKYIDKVDDLSVAPKVIWRGIGLIKVVPLPHWNSPFIKKEITQIFHHLHENGTKVVKLTDREALLVLDNKITKVRAKLLRK